MDQAEIKRIKETDLVPLPGAVGGSGLDGDPLFALEVHGIHLGANTVAPAHLVDLVDPAGVVEDPLCQRRLPGVDVRGDADVPHPVHRLPPPRRVLLLPRPQHRDRRQRPPSQGHSGRGRPRSGISEERLEIRGRTTGHGYRRLGIPWRRLRGTTWGFGLLVVFVLVLLHKTLA